MKNSFIYLQFIGSIYAIYVLKGEGIAYKMTIVLLCIHLVGYLVEKLLVGAHLKKLIKQGDIVFLISCLVLLNSAFSIPLLLLGGEKSIEEGQNKTPLYIVGIGAGSFIFSRPMLVLEWVVLIVITLFCIRLYEDEQNLKVLKNNNQELLEQVDCLNRQLQKLSKSKSEVEYVTKVAERNLLAQKLHDKLGHILAGNIMQLETVKIIIKRDQEKALELIEKTLQSLRSGMDDMRHTLRTLKPEQSELGIGRVKKLLEDVGTESPLQTLLTYEGDLERIDITTWSVIIQNVKESLTNAIKYSSGDLFKVHIEVLNKLIKVQCSDNGLPLKAYKKGLGLLGMEERMVEQSGRLVVDTIEGFQVLMLFYRENIS